MQPRPQWRRSQYFEALALLACLIVVGQIVFAGFLHPETSNYPLEYLCIPVLIWASYRFGQREAATATLVLSAMAVWSTLHGQGPFVRQSENESLLLLQAFMAVAAVLTMSLAAVFAERLAEYGIHVYEIRPATEGMDLPENVGKTVAALVSGNSTHSTGAVIVVSDEMNVRKA